MVFGHNTNFKFANVTLHVQTEDRGVSHGMIDTTVYYHGRVLHRRTNNYFDLLPLDEDRKQALKLRVDEQHRVVIEEIRSGRLQLAVPPEAASAPTPPAGSPDAHPFVPAANEPPKLSLELTNAKSWLSGKHATLQLTVREPGGNPAPGALVRLEIEGSENAMALQSQTSAEGTAQFEFDMPRITGAEPAIVIHAENHSAKGQLRFALRAKPRVA